MMGDHTSVELGRGTSDDVGFSTILVMNYVFHVSVHDYLQIHRRQALPNMSMSKPINIPIPACSNSQRTMMNHNFSSAKFIKFVTFHGKSHSTKYHMYRNWQRDERKEASASPLSTIEEEDEPVLQFQFEDDQLRQSPLQTQPDPEPMDLEECAGTSARSEDIEHSFIAVFTPKPWQTAALQDIERASNAFPSYPSSGYQSESNHGVYITQHISRFLLTYEAIYRRSTTTTVWSESGGTSSSSAGRHTATDG